MNNTTISFNSTINFSRELTLLELNSREAFNRLPVIIFVSVLMLLGILGNSHVVYIYYTKFTSSTYRVFVLCLAAIDLVSCFISMPFEIFDELHPYMFEDEVACKLFRFVNVTLAIATSLMLVVIASERYRRICRPQGKQLNEKQSLHALVAVVACAAAATIPALYVYGKKSIKIPGSDIKGTECTWGDHLDGSVFGYIFYGYTLLIVIVCMVALVVIYGILGKYLWKHTAKMSGNLRAKYQLKEPITLDVIEEETQEDVRRARESFRFKRKEEHAAFLNIPTTSDIQNGETTKKSEPTRNQNEKPVPKSPTKSPSQLKYIKLVPSTTRKRDDFPGNMKGLQKAFRNVTGREAGVYPLVSQAEKRVSDREKRITKVLFTITLLFIISFLPYIVILIIYVADESYESNMSNAEHALYLIGLRLYLLNNIANPFLYSSFDSKFRNHLTDMYSFLRAII